MEDPLISCICVALGGVLRLKRAVHCFLSQTYGRCELIILYEADDIDTRSYLRTLNESRIVSMEVQAMPRLSMGSLRNIAVRDAHGQYVAQWDEEDWSAPTRLAEQMKAIRNSDRTGCALLRCILFDDFTRNAMMSVQLMCESSLLAKRSALPQYPEFVASEDAVVATQMFNASQLVGLDSPELFVYIYNGPGAKGRARRGDASVRAAHSLTLEATQDIKRKLQAYMLTNRDSVQPELPA